MVSSYIYSTNKPSISIPFTARYDLLDNEACNFSLSLFAIWWRLFLSSITPTLALKCGTEGVTEQCMGDTDPSYDPDVLSYDCSRKEQSGLFYANIEGFFLLLLNTDIWAVVCLLQIDPSSILFRNTTVNGSRRMQMQTYQIIFTSTAGRPKESQV